MKMTVIGAVFRDENNRAVDMDTFEAMTPEEAWDLVQERAQELADKHDSVILVTDCARLAFGMDARTTTGVPT